MTTLENNTPASELAKAIAEVTEALESYVTYRDDVASDGLRAMEMVEAFTAQHAADLEKQLADARERTRDKDALVGQVRIQGETIDQLTARLAKAEAALPYLRQLLVEADLTEEAREEIEHALAAWEATK